jgi:hypothetical protein
LLEEAFKQPISTAVKKQLNVLRRNGVAGKNLFEALTGIYLEHGMGEYAFKANIKIEKKTEEIPRIICSMALV